jgi:hypothetical protein
MQWTVGEVVVLVFDPLAVLERVLDGGEGAVTVVHACISHKKSI